MKLILQIFVLLNLSSIFIQCQLSGAFLIVNTVLEIPMVMLRETAQANLTGNDRFEGYVVDLLDEISKVLKFQYVLQLNNATGSYGRKDETGKWNGMIGELIDQKIQIAAGSITITAERIKHVHRKMLEANKIVELTSLVPPEMMPVIPVFVLVAKVQCSNTWIKEEVVDFTVPFMNLGIGILYKKGLVTPPDIFDDLKWFLSPFKNYVTDTFLLLTSIFGVILLLLRRKYKTIMFRILLGIWLVFLFLFSSLFFAQLSSHYCLHAGVQYLYEEFRTVEDLASQSSIAYGCIEGGATQSFFQNSKSPIYSKMWHHMASRDPTPFVQSSTEGVERVINGSYAFFAESTMIEYVVSRYCDLRQVGGLLDSKGFGLAVQSGSTYRDPLNHAILVLEQQGILQNLKNKWWFERRGGGTCS